MTRRSWTTAGVSLIGVGWILGGVLAAIHSLSTAQALSGWVSVAIGVVLLVAGLVQIGRLVRQRSAQRRGEASDGLPGPPDGF